MGSSNQGEPAFLLSRSLALALPFSLSLFLSFSRAQTSSTRLTRFVRFQPVVLCTDLLRKVFKVAPSFGIFTHERRGESFYLLSRRFAMVPVATGKAFVFVRCFSLFEESEKFVTLQFQVRYKRKRSYCDFKVKLAISDCFVIGRLVKR